MSTIKINQKDYVIPTLGFREVETMESVAETSIVKAFQKEQIFIIVTAFVATVVDCDKEEAARLCEQHILGGGKLEDIYKAFSDAVNESGFFKKLLGIEEEEKTKGKSKKTKATEE